MRGEKGSKGAQKLTLSGFHAFRQIMGVTWDISYTVTPPSPTTPTPRYEMCGDVFTPPPPPIHLSPIAAHGAGEWGDDYLLILMVRSRRKLGNWLDVGCELMCLQAVSHGGAGGAGVSLSRR